MTELTPDQSRALDKIKSGFIRGGRHLLIGYAGTGKTTLMWTLTRDFIHSGKTVVLTAPTHKAVAVLERKLRENGISDVPCVTIHKLLELKKKTIKDKISFVRPARAAPIDIDVVVIDECSMLSSEMMGHIRRHMQLSYVVLVGDSAQIPPVGEVKSHSFDTKAKSELTKIMRQSEENPILKAAKIIRESQGGALDMSWCKRESVPPIGVFLPSNLGEWMKKGFTSKEFDEDPDSFRYLCWTNEKVATVNKKIREWRYGKTTEAPFVSGEMMLFRSPVIQDKSIVFSTNEEARVIDINKSILTHTFPATFDASQWSCEIPVWEIKARTFAGDMVSVFAPSSAKDHNKTIARIKDEAVANRERWDHFHEFNERLAVLQNIYAMTIHTSQGSTFKNVFLDVADIKRRAATNLLECQQLFYVGATRASTALILTGV